MSACYVTNAVLGTGNMSVNRAKNSAFLMLTLGQEMETTNNKYKRKVTHVVYYKVRRATDKGKRRARGDFRCGLKGSRLYVKWQSKGVCGSEGSRALFPTTGFYIF